MTEKTKNVAWLIFWTLWGAGGAFGLATATDTVVAVLYALAVFTSGMNAQRHLWALLVPAPDPDPAPTPRSKPDPEVRAAFANYITAMENIGKTGGFTR